MVPQQRGRTGGAGLLLHPYLPGFGWLPRRRRESSRLERALAAVERARGGETAEERKALELLADELRKSGSGGLAWTATELAWSPSEPPPDQTVALTETLLRQGIPVLFLSSNQVFDGRVPCVPKSLSVSTMPRPK